MTIKIYPLAKKARDWLMAHGRDRLANKAHYLYLDNKMRCEHVTLEIFLKLMRSYPGTRETYSHGTYIFTEPNGMRVIVVPKPEQGIYRVTFQGHSIDYLTKEERKALDEE
jgi:hypothetical protein